MILITAKATFSKEWSSTVIADVHSNLNHYGVVILQMVNGCNGLNLMAYSWSGQSLRRLIGWAGLVLTCLSRRVLGLNGSRKVK